jgi:hypothetical protein
MAANSPNYSLIEAGVRRLKLPWYLATIISAIFLLVVLVFFAYLDGALTRFHWNYWSWITGSTLIITSSAFTL